MFDGFFGKGIFNFSTLQNYKYQIGCYTINQAVCCMLTSKQVLIGVLLIILASSTTIQSASALSAWDQACSNCQGTGHITTHSTQTCTACNGLGTITTSGTCPTCQGSGKVTTFTTCSICGGDGKVAPRMTQISKSGFGALSGLDWVARIEVTYQNEAEQGTYGTVRTTVHTVTNDYVHSSVRTYFPPHTNVKVTVDTPEVGTLTDWTYSVSLSVDDITCSACDGSGGRTTITTCGTCNGQGQVTQTTTCNNCHGTGQITIDSEIPCPECNGNGYVTNWGLIAIVMVCAFAGIGAVTGAGLFIKKKKKP